MDKDSEKGGRRRRLDHEAAARIRAQAQGRGDMAPEMPPEIPPPSDAAPLAGDAPDAAAEPSARAGRGLSAILSKTPRNKSAPTPRGPHRARVQDERLRENWARLREIPVDPRLMERNLIITAAREQHAHVAFDVLRTRMVQALAERGWRRVAVTSPTKGCGKSFTALNLAVALSRHQSLHTALLDLDLRKPALARRLGVKSPGAIGDVLLGRVSPLDHMVRFGTNRMHIGGNVTLGLNGRVEPYASELLLHEATSDALARIEEELAPDVVLIDMPPALAHDDALALRDHVDCLLMVVGAGVTTPRDLRESVRRLGEDKPVLGIVLNKADSVELGSYSY